MNTAVASSAVLPTATDAAPALPGGYRFCPRCATALSRGVPLGADDPRERTLCGNCGWVHWDNPLPVVAALVQLGDKILLARNAAWTPGKFALIAGFMERGETPEAGIAREVMEETGLTVVEHNMIGVYPFLLRNELLLVYHVRAEGDVHLSPELAEYKLVDPADLVPWPQGTGPAVGDWMRSQGLVVPDAVPLP
ncbi:NUDIX domain-containing protein [Pigmentiphaga aceris]|uniref:NUDIX domain-containing protein n=2 Tax=Pigmentiphaga aceris TaxID=1940612 RepID=A0A5C0B1S3_9BURK|nr:NUDIX domain-containing protein [Pigmentiphaga aceris]QEI07713.1 NUDIX domain-containing protein [Pigmentiphaga aceris]